MSFKKAVQSSFSRAAGTYADYSEVQQKAADDLVYLLLERLEARGFCLDANLSLLDVGCGPAIMESRLKRFLPKLKYVGMDISPEMAREGRKARSISSSGFLAGDMDSLPFRHDTFDVVVSSSTLQWSTPESFPWMQEVRRVLHSKGVFCFNLMIDGSLDNFYRAYQESCNTSISLHRYPNQSLLRKELVTTFKNCSFEERNYRKSYSSLLGFLRDIQKTGARSALKGVQPGITKNLIAKTEKKLRDDRGGISMDYRFCFAAMETE